MPPGLVRLVLACIVVVSHFTKISFGTAAVDLFFVLSGYWIYRMYERKYARAPYPAALFLASRVLRILPVFLLFNTLALLIHSAWQDSVFAAQGWATVLPNILVLGYASLPKMPLVPAWSLDMEMQFYLLFPILFAAVKGFGKHGWTLTVAALAVSTASAFLFTGNPALVIAFLGLFILGVQAARNGWQPGGATITVSALASIALIACFLALPPLRGFAVHGVNDTRFAWNEALNFILALALAPVALASVHHRSGKTDRMLGELSYIVYCSHWLAFLVADRYLTGLARSTKAPFVILLLLATGFVSVMVLVYLDSPVSRWRERWVARCLLH